MNGLGIHLLLELKECNPELLNDLGYIRQALTETAHDVGATVVGESFHRFSPQGVTGILGPLWFVLVHIPHGSIKSMKDPENHDRLPIKRVTQVTHRRQRPGRAARA